MHRTLHPLPLALVAALALAACQRKGVVGVELPRYPDGQYFPRDPQRDLDEGIVYRGELHTADAYQSVVKFYVETLGALPGWKGPKWQATEIEWGDGNLARRGDHVVRVLDPSKSGGLVYILDAGSRTVVRLWKYEPNPAPAP